MQKSADSVARLMDGYRQRKFTGGIKLGFEQGRLVNCSEYSDPKESPPPIPADFSLRERLKKACASDYYGSHLFILKEGEITHTSFIQTWASRGIQILLGESPTGGGEIGASLS